MMRLLLLSAGMFWVAACTTTVEQTLNPDNYPPTDNRPLPEAPSSLPSVEGETVAEGLAEPRQMAIVGAELWVAERQGGQVLAIELSSRKTRVVAADLGEPWALAAAGDGAVVSDVAGGRVLRIAADGTTNVVASGQSQPKQIQIKDNEVYWLNEGEAAGSSWTDGSIQKASLDGSDTPSEVASNLDKPRCLAMDDTHIFFLEAGPPTQLMRLPLAGGDAESLATSNDEGFDCTLSPEGKILWATHSPNWPYSGWVRRAENNGQNPIRLTASQARLSHVTASDKHVYWAYIDGVQRIASDGTGTVNAVATAVATASLFLHDTNIYISDRLNGKIRAFPQ